MQYRRRRAVCRSIYFSDDKKTEVNRSNRSSPWSTANHFREEKAFLIIEIIDNRLSIPLDCCDKILNAVISLFLPTLRLRNHTSPPVRNASGFLPHLLCERRPDLKLLVESAMSFPLRGSVGVL